MKQIFTHRLARQLIWGSIVLILAAITLAACGASKYDYVGTWKEQPDRQTYINSDQNMAVTFPAGSWQIYTQPTGEVKNLWDLPLWNDSAVTLMIATAPEKQMVQIISEPNPGGILLEDYLKAVKYDIDSAYGSTRKLTWQEPKKLEHGGRLVGILDYAYEPDETIMAVIEGRMRFVVISYSCPVGEFDKHEDIFWSIVDSYRPLGR